MSDMSTLINLRQHISALITLLKFNLVWHRNKTISNQINIQYIPTILNIVQLCKTKQL